jgi:hypothetical protein
MKASRSISVKVKKKSTPGTAGKTKSSTCNPKLFSAHCQKKIKSTKKIQSQDDYFLYFRQESNKIVSDNI